MYKIVTLFWRFFRGQHSLYVESTDDFVDEKFGFREADLFDVTLCFKITPHKLISCQ